MADMVRVEWKVVVIPTEVIRCMIDVHLTPTEVVTWVGLDRCVDPIPMLGKPFLFFENNQVFSSNHNFRRDPYAGNGGYADPGYSQAAYSTNAGAAYSTGYGAAAPPATDMYSRRSPGPMGGAGGQRGPAMQGSYGPPPSRGGGPPPPAGAPSGYSSGGAPPPAVGGYGQMY